MKRFIHKCSLLCFGVAAIWCSSCSKDGYVKYDADYASLRFIYTAYGNDSIVYSFALYPDKEEGIVEIPFKLVGLASGQARKVKVEVVKEETTAKENDNFVVETSELPADSIKATLKIRVKKTPDLENRNLDVKFRLSSNDYFAAAPVDESMYRIILTNHLTQPKGWPFGDWSRVKHQFVIQILGIAADYDKWSQGERIHYTSIMVDALYQYNKEHPGNFLTDENGLLISF